MQSEIWDEVWQNADQNVRKHKAERKIDLLLTHLDVQPSWKVADFGCGAAYLAQEFIRRKNCSVVGVDFAAALNGRIEPSERFSFIKADVSKTGLPDGQFDLVLCCNILEHVQDYATVLAEIHRVLKFGGHAFIFSSNKRSVMVAERLARQATDTWHWGYQQEWTSSELEKILKIQKFRLMNKGNVIGLADYKWAAYIDRWLARLFGDWGRYNWFLCKKVKYLDSDYNCCDPNFDETVDELTEAFAAEINHEILIEINERYGQ